MRARLRCAGVVLAGALSLSCTAATNTSTEASGGWGSSSPGAWSVSTKLVLLLLNDRGSLRSTDCYSGQNYRIIEEEDFEALRNAVAGDSTRSGRVVSFFGRTRLQNGNIIANPPLLEAVVDQFLAVWPEETCEKAGVHTTLDNTYWKLVELNGSPVTTHENQRETHVILRTQSNQLGGFAGCNVLGGRYEVDGDRLRFVGLTSTETVCPYLDEERAFIAVLSRVTNYQSVGESLQLRDDNGPIARFRAVYFR